MDELRYLPKEVSWWYYQCKRGIGWTWRGTSKTGYYFKEFSSGTNIFNKANKSFEGFNRTIQNPRYEIDKVILVYNPTLVSNFIGSYKVQLGRLGEKLFQSTRWSLSEDGLLKELVKKEFEDYCGLFEWNGEGKALIIPVLHGTDLVVAEKICETGFATLSSVDAGYYGRGIYFTTYSSYTVSYICSRANPVVLMSWLLPGNVFPVTEAHDGEKSLLGSALQNGYNSHYVLTDSSGKCLRVPKAKHQGMIYDEFVVNQESQISPSIIFVLSLDSVASVALDWANPKKKTPLIDLEVK